MVTNYTLPFSVVSDDILYESHGILSFSDGKLHLQIQQVDGFLGVIKKDVQIYEIPYSKLVELSFKKGVFSDKLTLQLNDMRLSHDIPGSTSGRVVMKIKKKERSQAQSLVSSVMLGLSEYRIEQLGE